MLKLETFPVGPLGCNCSLLWDADTGEGIVMDPGGEGGRIARRVGELGFKVKALIHSHAHFDHVGATKELQDLWQVPALLHPGDTFLIEVLDQQTELFGMPRVQPPEMEELHIGDRFQGLVTLHTPGHTPGSCCFHGDFEQGQVVLAGDTLFRGSVGRTDLWGGNWDQLETSIQRELFTLDERTLVIPGHGPATTIGREISHNPYLHA